MTSYHIEQRADVCRITFSAGFENVDVVCRYLERFLDRWNLAPLRFDMVLGAREILNNAVVHGSQNNPDRQVLYEARLEGQQLIMTVEDQGAGFDFDVVSRACQVDRDCGRGICILERYFNEIRFTPPGNIVTVIRNLEVFSYAGGFNMTDIVKEGDLAVVKLEGDIVSSTIERLRAEFKQVLKGDVKRLQLDLADVGYVDSMGLGLLVATHNSMMKNGFRLALRNVSADIARLLKQMRLDQHFDLE
jgi:serine/threonine-protein kinase RsbW